MERPELAANAFHAIAVWSGVDGTLGKLLVTLLKADYRAVLEIYESLTSWGPKRQAVTAAAKHSLADDEFAVLLAILDRFKSTRNRRNSLAHDIWGCAPELPDAILCVEAKHTQREWSDMRVAIETPGVTSAEWRFLSHDLIDVWKLPDIEQLIQETAQVGEMINLLQLAVASEPGLRGKVLDWLRSQLGIEPAPQTQPLPQNPSPRPQSPQATPSG